MYFPHLTLKENWQVKKAIWIINHGGFIRYEKLEPRVNRAIKGLITAKVRRLRRRLDDYTNEKITADEIIL